MIFGMRMFQIREREIEKENREEYDGSLVYYDPLSGEYAIFPREKISRLRGYIRDARSPREALAKASKKGFSLYFQAFKRPFTNVLKYDILYKNKPPITITGKDNAMNLYTFNCLHYNQRISPVLCFSRSIIYPMNITPSPYYLELKEKLKDDSNDKKEKRRIIKELRKHSPIMDPYPKCRSCIMQRKLMEDSCLGIGYDPEDPNCQECAWKKECCQLMRLRIEKILQGNEDKVIKEILESRKLSQQRKEVNNMAKKGKREVEEITEEVIDADKETVDKKAARRKKNRSSTKKNKPARAEEEEEVTVSDKEDKKAARKKRRGKEEDDDTPAPKKKGKKDPVKALLKELAQAKEEGDQVESRRVRKELRAVGYSLRSNK